MPTFWKTDLHSIPKKEKVAKIPKPIKTISKTNKNTRRTFTKEAILEVFERDGYACILCKSQDIESAPHHAFYGGEANHGTDRNDTGQVVTICKACHYAIHSKGDNEKRDACKKYLETISWCIKCGKFHKRGVNCIEYEF